MEIIDVAAEFPVARPEVDPQIYWRGEASQTLNPIVVFLENRVDGKKLFNMFLPI